MKQKKIYGCVAVREIICRTLFCVTVVYALPVQGMQVLVTDGGRGHTQSRGSVVDGGHAEQHIRRNSLASPEFEGSIVESSDAVLIQPRSSGVKKGCAERCADCVPYTGVALIVLSIGSPIIFATAFSTSTAGHVVAGGAIAACICCCFSCCYGINQRDRLQADAQARQALLDNPYFLLGASGTPGYPPPPYAVVQRGADLPPAYTARLSNCPVNSGVLMPERGDLVPEAS
jgi:hypothetical protein